MPFPMSAPERPGLARAARSAAAFLLGAVLLACDGGVIEEGSFDVRQLDLQPTALELQERVSAPLSAMGRTRFGGLLALRAPVTYRSTDPAVATVDAAGLVLAVAPGRALVVGRVAERTGTFADTVAVLVTRSAPVSGRR
jgi:hypothetical protein